MDAALATCRCVQDRQGEGCTCAHLEAVEVLGLEVIGGTAAPVHDVLVLALAPQLAVPVGDTQVVVNHGVTMGAVLQDCVEEGLQGEKVASLRPLPAFPKYTGCVVLLGASPCEKVPRTPSVLHGQGGQLPHSHLVQSHALSRVAKFFLL